MSIEEATRYINDKLSGNTCYRFKENKNVGINWPNYIVNTINGDIGIDEDDDVTYVL